MSDFTSLLPLIPVALVATLVAHLAALDRAVVALLSGLDGHAVHLRTK